MPSEAARQRFSDDGDIKTALEQVSLKPVDRAALDRGAARFEHEPGSRERVLQ